MPIPVLIPSTTLGIEPARTPTVLPACPIPIPGITPWIAAALLRRVSLRVIQRLGMADLPSWARVGAKVVCVLDFTKSKTVDDRGYRGLPKQREIYTILKAFICTYGVPVVTLREFEIDHYFDLRGFRPLVTDEQKAADLALFKSWLPHNETEPA